jgi:integrase
MAKLRRDKGTDAIFFDHEGNECHEPVRHRRCQGRWRGEVNLGHDGAGRRIRRKASGQTKAAVQDQLKRIRRDLELGVTSVGSVNYSVRKCAEDWLENGLSGRAAKTIRKNRDVLNPILALIGETKLRELTAADVDRALKAMAKSYSTAAVRMGHLALKRCIRFAAARDLVGRNVAELAESPMGQAGRPSKSLTLEQAATLIRTSKGTRIGAYITLCLATGIRTEEARALRWEAVDLGNPTAHPPRPASVAVWRSVRASGDTKTERSRRTLALPAIAADALSELREREPRDSGPVFATKDGHELDAANVRREFRAAVRAAGIAGTWTPRELRHTFVSLLSDSGVPVEEIARLAGHASSRTTELVYRHQLRPVMERGAEAIDALFGRDSTQNAGAA